MSGYTHAHRITCDESTDKGLPAGMQRWCTSFDRYPYMIRYDGGNLHSLTEHCATLTEARKVAKRLVRAGGTTWAEIHRWCESGVQLRKVWICTYERELIVT